MRRLVRNAARCTDCGTVIESKHRHDFRACKCGGSFVDGGLSYLRRSGNLIDLSEYTEDEELSYEREQDCAA